MSANQTVQTSEFGAALKDALENPIAIPSKPSAAAPAPTASPARQESVRLTREDRQARRLARMSETAETTKLITHIDVTDYIEITAELAGYEKELNLLASKSRTVSVDELNETRQTLDKRIRDCKDDLESMRVEFGHRIVTKVLEREQLQALARNEIRVFKALDPANHDRDEVKATLSRAVDNDLLRLASGAYVAAVEDSVLRDLEAEVNLFFEAVAKVREDDQTRRRVRVAEFYVSDRSPAPGKDSLLHELKKKPGTVSLTLLRSGKGTRAFVPVHGKKRDEDGQSIDQEYFMGEAIVELQDGVPTVVKASREQLCEKVFYSYNPAKKESVKRGAFPIPTNLEELHPAFLREAFKRQLALDAESTARREKAEKLADVLRYKDAVTFADLRVDQAGRWIVDAEWFFTVKVKGQDVQSRKNVTFHVESDGKNFQITEAACNLEEVDKDFFGMYLKPTPVSALSTDKRWPALAHQNRPFERDGQLHKAASTVEGNVPYITRENVADCLGTEEVDGLYRAPAEWEQKAKGSDAPRYVQIGYLVERRGDNIQFTYATPGTAEGIVEKEKGWHSISDLPLMTRAVARAIWAGARGWKTIPEHLKPAANGANGKKNS